MATETQKKPAQRAVRISEEKVERAARLARLKAVKEDRQVPMSKMIDEIIDEGLGKCERRYGIQ